MINSSAENRPQKAEERKFYVVSLDYRIRTVAGWEMENLERLLDGRRTLGPPVGQRGFVKFPEPPRLLIDGYLGRPPIDWEEFEGYWIVSDRMKTVLETLDSNGVAFVKCETRHRDGSAGPVYWLCDVIRVLDAVDEQKSRVKLVYDSPDRKRYSLLGGANLFFREEIVGSAHIFRLRFSTPNIICDESVKEACRKAGLKGIGFKDAASY